MLRTPSPESTRNATIRTSEPSECNKEVFRSDTFVKDRNKNNKVTLLQSCLDSKGHGNHQETHGKEILTKGAVLKHKKAVATVSEREATCQNFFSLKRIKGQTKVRECIHKQWCSQKNGEAVLTKD